MCAACVAWSKAAGIGSDDDAWGVCHFDDRHSEQLGHALDCKLQYVAAGLQPVGLGLGNLRVQLGVEEAWRMELDVRDRRVHAKKGHQLTRCHGLGAQRFDER